MMRTTNMIFAGLLLGSASLVNAQATAPAAAPAPADPAPAQKQEAAAPSSAANPPTAPRLSPARARDTPPARAHCH